MITTEMKQEIFVCASLWCGKRQIPSSYYAIQVHTASLVLLFFYIPRLTILKTQRDKLYNNLPVKNSSRFCPEKKNGEQEQENTWN